MSEITEAQLQAWEAQHQKRFQSSSLGDVPVCSTCRVSVVGFTALAFENWPCPMAELLASYRTLRAAHEPLRDAVVREYRAWRAATTSGEAAALLQRVMEAVDALAQDPPR